MNKKILIIGAGPAGLTAAYELLRTGQYDVTIFEETGSIGGISKTVNINGNRMDIGGHRFFSKVPEVNDWWEMMMPAQGAGSKDDLVLGRNCTVKAGGPDPEKTDRVMLLRQRVSRIYFKDKFFDYPVSFKKDTLAALGFAETLKCGFSYLSALIRRLPENNLENFYINRFGRRLYGMFFEHYTEKVWGKHPSDIDASWGNQRVKGLSVSAVIKNAGQRLIPKKNRTVETSLIEEFKYPKLGPGQIWEITASEIKAMGGEIQMNSKVSGIHRGKDGRITDLTCVHDDKKTEIAGDIVISSMPLKDLVAGMDHVPDHIAQIASALPYRDYMTVGVLIRKLKLKNNTRIKTVGGIVPDCWIYIQDREVKTGRIQIYNNWSPYLVKNLQDTVWLGLEYFVQEGDEYWNMSNEDFSAFAINELIRLGFIGCKNDVLDWHVERVKKAYPAYFDTYNEIKTLTDYLKTIPNLYCVGRNGQHRYNNMDHSMCTSFEAVKNIISGCKNKDNVWNVNTEKEYHER